MCRTHTTQHELSAIAPNFQWVHLFASLGFADIRVGAPAPTSLSSLYALARSRGCTLLHALPARKRLRPLSPHSHLPTRSTRIALDTYCAKSGNGVAPASAVTLLQVWPSAHAQTQHSTRNMPYATCNMQHSTCNMQHTQPNLEGRRRSLRRRCCKLACRCVGLPAHVCRWEWSGVTNGLRG